jgi:flagellin-specific chaperone FliS
MIDKDSYALRVSHASTAQLVVITFELAEDFITDALSAGGDKESFRLYLEKAKNAVLQLIRGLDLSNGLAQDFFQIYQYLHKLLTDAYFRHKPEPAREALEHIQTLLTGWREAASVQAAAVPAMEAHAPQVYAGLTYQRDGLAEYVVQDESRGFKA